VGKQAQRTGSSTPTCPPQQSVSWS